MPEIIFTGPAGRLEGRFQPAKRKNGPIALVLHPHPQFGGTMNNQIAYQLFGFLALVLFLAPPASVVQAMPSRSESFVIPVPLGTAPQVSDCSRLRHESPEAMIRTQPPFGWRQAWIESSAVVAAPPPTASTPPAAIAAAHASPSAPSRFLRLDFMGLLPVELTRPG